ncbi:hypothetical protein, partial [Klebsiella pneumoniae]|uniref:hypothetical protein n=1 Tax=Klebsiella pneumoniae TaxID=573 RepID=UPI0019544169
TCSSSIALAMGSGTLGAIGASPSIRRKLSLCQAGVISILGTVQGVAAGVGACWVVMSALLE